MKNAHHAKTSFQLRAERILVRGDDPMPLEDSERPKDIENEQRRLREDTSFPASGEEIVTPIEADAQETAEREFHSERQTPLSCRTAIVSVNGEDVDKVPLETHDRAA
jgi:hypothetical protein